MDEDEKLLTTGRVIAAARQIETRLAECGASGSGLREKVQSLGPRLPARDRCIDEGETAFFGFFIKFPRDSRGNRGVIDEDRAALHSRERMRRYRISTSGMCVAR